MRQQARRGVVLYALLVLVLFQHSDVNDAFSSRELAALPVKPASRPCCLLSSKRVLPWALLPWVDYVFDTADDLTHHYGAGTWSYISRAEVNGLAYTCSLGFIDLGHVRHVTDLTYYYYSWLAGMTRPGDTLKTVDYNGRLELTRPLPGDDLNLRLQLARSVAYDESIFYEIATYWSKRKGEHHSAFSPEDTVSNLVGTYVAAQAVKFMEVESTDFDTAVTQVLTETLKRLGVLPSQDTRHALSDIQDVWFTGSPRSLAYLQKRNFDYDPARPWRLSAVKGCSGRQLFLDPVRPLTRRLHDYYVVTYKLPRTFTNAVLQNRFEISPGFSGAAKGAATAYVSGRDFAYQIGRIKAHARATYGPEFDRYTTTSVTRRVVSRVPSTRYFPHAKRPPRLNSAAGRPWDERPADAPRSPDRAR